MDINRSEIIENKFPLYLRLDTNRELIKMLSLIDVFKGKWIVIENRRNRNLDKLKKEAFFNSIHSSIKSDGVKLSKEEIEVLIKSNHKILDTTDKQKFYGYYESFSQIIKHHETISLTDSYLKKLHLSVLKYCIEDKQHIGNYKKHQNTVVYDFPDSDQTIILNTTKPKRVQLEIFELFEWINAQLLNNSLHPLIVIATFLYEFTLIQPFQHSNGLLSRLLIDLLLLQQEYYFIQYISLEQIIEERKEAYYTALISGQQNRRPGDELIELWIFFFIDCIEKIVIKLESKYKLNDRKGVYLNERQKKLKEFILKSQPVKISDIEKNLKQYSRNTLKKDLLFLIDENMISKFGERKGTVYIVETKE